MGLEVNLAALDGRRERVKLTSQLSRGVGSGTQEGRPRRSTTRTGRVGAFLTAEGRFHVRERFSIFRSRAETWVFERPKTSATEYPCSQRGRKGCCLLACLIHE
jgi:hypothetical protein